MSLVQLRQYIQTPHPPFTKGSFWVKFQQEWEWGGKNVPEALTFSFYVLIIGADVMEATMNKKY